MSDIAWKPGAAITGRITGAEFNPNGTTTLEITTHDHQRLWIGGSVVVIQDDDPAGGYTRHVCDHGYTRHVCDHGCTAVTGVCIVDHEQRS